MDFFENFIKDFSLEPMDGLPPSADFICVFVSVYEKIVVIRRDLQKLSGIKIRNKLLRFTRVYCLRKLYNLARRGRKIWRISVSRYLDRCR